MVTETPSSETGRVLLTKLAAVQVSVIWERLEPKMATQVAGAKPG